MKKLILLPAIVGILVGGVYWYTGHATETMQFVATLSADAPTDKINDLQAIITANVQSKLSALALPEARPVLVTVSTPMQLSIHNVPASAMPDVTLAMLEPFSFDLMVETVLTEADIVIGETSAYKKTGITAADITWVEASPVNGTEGSVLIDFNPAGEQKLQELYKNNVNKKVGIFVRNRLIAELLVQSENSDKDIHIYNIPSFDMAALFADDVTTGRYTTFSQ